MVHIEAGTEENSKMEVRIYHLGARWFLWRKVDRKEVWQFGREVGKCRKECYSRNESLEETVEGNGMEECGRVDR